MGSTTKKVDAAAPWMNFWGGEHSIYVNARHARVHYERITRDVTTLLRSRDQPTVLDWGCGDALSAPAIAPACGSLLLYDAVPAVRERLTRRFDQVANITVLTDATWQGLPAASIDVAIIVSVIQYLSRADLERVLDALRRLVRPDGELIVADVIPTSAGLLPDIASLLATGARHGFLLAAGAGLVQTFFSEYRRIRKHAGFSTYEEAEFRALLTQHGFSAERLADNVGFNQQRMTFRGRPSA